MRNRPEKSVSVDKKTGRVRVKTINAEPTKTQQQFKDECDINNIMKRYASTGEFLHLTKKKGVYGDFSQIDDYQGMLDKVQQAQEAFMTLPADVRTRFQNDPGSLISFLQDEKNHDEGVKLGLINPKIAETIKRDDSNNANEVPAQKI